MRGRFAFFSPGAAAAGAKHPVKVRQVEALGRDERDEPLHQLGGRQHQRDAFLSFVGIPAILAATQPALLPDSPAEMREGWIRVAPTKP